MNIVTRERTNGQGQMTKRKGQIGDIRAIEHEAGNFYFVLAGYEQGDALKVSGERFRAALQVGYESAGLQSEPPVNGRHRYRFTRRWVRHDEVNGGGE